MASEVLWLVLVTMSKSSSDSVRNNQASQGSESDRLVAMSPMVAARSEVAKELLFLVADFLDRATPCHASAAALKRELVQHRLLPTTVDWRGHERTATLGEMRRKTARLGPTFLVNSVHRLVGSLVGSGRNALRYVACDAMKPCLLLLLLMRPRGSMCS